MYGLVDRMRIFLQYGANVNQYSYVSGSDILTVVHGHCLTTLYVIGGNVVKVVKTMCTILFGHEIGAVPDYRQSL